MKPENIRITCERAEPAPVPCDFEGEHLYLRGELSFWYRWFTAYEGEAAAQHDLYPLLLLEKEKRAVATPIASAPVL